jgi:hypothetical protein
MVDIANRTPHPHARGAGLPHARVAAGVRTVTGTRRAIGVDAGGCRRMAARRAVQASALHTVTVPVVPTRQAGVVRRRPCPASQRHPPRKKGIRYPRRPADGRGDRRRHAPHRRRPSRVAAVRDDRRAPAARPAHSGSACRARRRPAPRVGLFGRNGKGGKRRSRHGRARVARADTHPVGTRPRAKAAPSARPLKRIGRQRSSRIAAMAWRRISA